MISFQLVNDDRLAIAGTENFNVKFNENVQVKYLKSREKKLK